MVAPSPEQAETKKKSGSGGGTESSGGTGGSYGGGSDEEKTEEELAALKNHVYYTYGSSGGETMYGSYSQLYAQALGMQIDENGNPLVDEEGHWAWDGVTDAETQRNTIISKLDIRPDTTALISEINAYYRVIDRTQYDEATTIPTEEVWYEFRSDVKWSPTEDDHVVTGKQYYNAGHQPILNPETKIYSAVSNPEGSPVENQWYEYIPANDPPYTASADVSVVAGKTYYEKKTPKEMRWRERNEAGNYVETRDNKPLINYPDKTYYMRRSDGGEKILSSSVEVHPGDVIIQSLNQPIYKQVDDTTGKNPKDEGWYEKNGSSYTKTTDQTPVSGKTYYTRFAISSGVVEVQPGDILIEAINQNSDSSVKIKANQITLTGNTTVDGMLKVDNHYFYVIGGNISATKVDGTGGDVTAVNYQTGSGGYVKFVGTQQGENYDLTASNVEGLITGFGTATTDPNTGEVTIPYYTVHYPTEATRPAGNVITFNKAQRNATGLTIGTITYVTSQGPAISIPVTVNYNSGSSTSLSNQVISSSNLPLGDKTVDATLVVNDSNPNPAYVEYSSSTDNKIGYSTFKVNKVKLQSKTYTPKCSSSSTVVRDNGYDALDSVVVSAVSVGTTKQSSAPSGRTSQATYTENGYYDIASDGYVQVNVPSSGSVNISISTYKVNKSAGWNQLVSTLGTSPNANDPTEIFTNYRGEFSSTYWYGIRVTNGSTIVRTYYISGTRS